MAIELPPLPFDRSALEPHLSIDTLQRHHGEYLKANVEAVNIAIRGTALAESSLAEIVRKSQGMLFNHAAQAWNGTFYFNGLKAAAGGGGGEPGGKLAEAIAKSFGDVARFKLDFAKVAGRVFGSGWVWLVQRADGGLAIIATPNAATPLTGDDTPLLACCLWEHAYAIDYGSARGRYIDAFWSIVNWDWATSRMK